MMKKFSLLLCYAFLFIVFSFSASGENGGVVVVYDIVGKGVSRQFALADAFRNAISQALGTYVVTSRTWDGETLDKKIFDNSDAVVSKHWIVDESESDGMWSVTIDAEIVQNEMIKFIHKEATTKVEEGELANLLAKRKTVDNAVQSLELLFQNWRENVYRVEKYGNISIAADDNVGEDTVRVSVPFIITFRWDVYGMFLDKVRNVLSRIAIGTGQGVRADGDSWDLPGKHASLYASLNLKDDWGRVLDNPNEYGEVRIVSRLSSGEFRYEIYIVPKQIKQALDRLLVRNAEIHFSFKSKGGENIASQTVSCQVYSFGWNYLLAYGSYSGFRLSSGWHSFDDRFECIGFMDEIETSFKQFWHDDRESTNQRLYHVAVPVPISVVSRIVGCTITVRPQSEKSDWQKVTSEAVGLAEWNKIDCRPIQPIQQKMSVSEVNGGVQSSLQQKSANAIFVGSISISENDKKLKPKIVELSLLSPNTASAKKWFALLKNVESLELRQAVLKVVGAALVFDKKNSVYQAKIRDRINDASTFDDSFYEQCPRCGGVRTTKKKCPTCAGSGVCKYANCRGGVRLVRGFKGLGGDHYERCRKCSGSGVCQNCNGSGTVIAKCFHCGGEGRIFSIGSASKIYHQMIEQISNAF